MMRCKPRFTLSLGVAAAISGLVVGAYAVEPARPDDLRVVVDRVITPLMAAQNIPGMAVAVTIDGRTRVFNYGLASGKEGRKVDDRTLFEIGSLSKTFTGTLGGYVLAKGRIALSDPAPKHLPVLAGTVFDRITLLDLGTYTAGGLPLQFPDDVKRDAETTAYFKAWQPRFPPGAQRLYSNPSIGLFGDLAARGDGTGFRALMADTVLPKLGLRNTFLTVTGDAQARYAFGTKDGKPVRVSQGAFDAQAYGIKTTAGDMARFVALSMDPSSLEPALRQAVTAAQTGYVKFGRTMQGLGWEIYEGAASLDTVLAGNASAMALEPQPATKLEPPVSPRPDRFVNKTGSTNGFGAYAAFLPEKRIGVVLLANRNFPIPERIKAAWSILEGAR